MRIDILTNSLMPGDAVSAHCLLLRRHCLALGHQARIVAPHADSPLAGEIVPPATLSERCRSNSRLKSSFGPQSGYQPG